MPNYKYVAKNQQGNTISAILDAKDKTSLIDLLRKKGLVIISVEQAKRKAFELGSGAKVKLEELERRFSVES